MMILEAYPGDVAGLATSAATNGHLWGFVQSIKRSSLVSRSGDPLFVSTGATSNVSWTG
jgi:hypothetical protein